jgi:Ca-activated chloride channel homolog
MWEAKEITFNLPYAGFLLFLLVPLLFAQFALMRYRKRQQQAYAASTLLPRLLIPRSSTLTYTKIFGWGLIWTLACLALMGPYGNIRYASLGFHRPSPPSPVKPFAVPHEVIFLVDTSASMLVPDGSKGETRLEVSKAIIEDVIRQLRGQTASLYAFTSELTPLVPPTLDYLFLRLATRELHINEGDVGGTRFAPVLKALQQQAFPKISPKYYTVIMLTDGGDTELETLKGEAREKAREAILNAISDPQKLHLRLFTVGIGSLKPQPIPHVTFEGKPVFSQLEPDILKQLALQERGKYYMAQQWTSWNLAQDLISQISEDESMEQLEAQNERQVATVKKGDILTDLYFQIPLGLVILFYYLNFLLPDVRHL